MINPLQIKFNLLLQKASAISGFSIESLKTSKKRPIVYYRYIIYYLCKKDGYSCNEIARISNRNHSTILHDLSEIEYLIEHNYGIQNIYDAMSEKPSLEEEIAQWLKLPESSNPVLTAIHFYNLR